MARSSSFVSTGIGPMDHKRFVIRSENSWLVGKPCARSNHEHQILDVVLHGIAWNQRKFVGGMLLAVSLKRVRHALR